MSTDQTNRTSRSEHRTLMISAGGNLLIGVVGIVFASFSKSQAILLDGLFNLTYFATGLFALKVSGLIQRGDDERFPMGYAFFEPLGDLLLTGPTNTNVMDLRIVLIADS